MHFVIPTLFNPNAHPRAVRRAVGHRAAAVRQNWRDHNARIRPLLPPSLQRLQETQLHDGLIRSLRNDAGKKTLHLSLLCDDRDGYFDLTLDYTGIQLTAQETSLLCLIAHEKSAEIYWDEIDLEGSEDAPIFIHRILWNTRVQTDREFAGESFDGEAMHIIYNLKPEIELRFSGLELHLNRRTDGQFVRDDDFITVVRDPDKIEGMDA